MKIKEQTDSDQRSEGEVDDRGKKGSMYKGPWTKTVGWGLSLGVGVGGSRGEQWGKNRDNYN